MDGESAWSEASGQAKISPLLSFYRLLLDVMLCALRSSLDLCLVLLRHQHERRKRSREWIASYRKVLRSKGRRRPRYAARFPRKRLVRPHWYALAEVGNPRRWWVYPCRKHWWEKFVAEVWDADRWIENFRMSRGTLFSIVEVLRPRIERQRTVMRAPIATEKRVAITVWWLANKECYRIVGQQFGVARSTVAEIVLEVCFAIDVDLLRKTVCLGEVDKIMDGFGHLGFPHCIGALGETLIPIRAPLRQAEEYRKQLCSVLLQGITDHTGRFIDVEVGWSSLNHDAHIFRNSSVCAAMDAGAFVPGNPTIAIGGVQVPPLIVTRGCYPMRRWLMKPYRDPDDSRRSLFDDRLGKAHSVVECAFRRLRARWRCMTVLPVTEENATAVVMACVILHNICEERGHVVQGDLCETQAVLSPADEGTYQCSDDDCCSAAGNSVRDAISTFMQTPQTGP
ncbi:PREDICTED: putative nuclease HARBI1 [Gekko japonicus]|uniref:Nuclease HARBI1 n=1 Tax=Gekko japonicus TaxID=146911 RepID=A0ABM1L8F7_GEKJA|nr:PREDICTED: putative nuclease HARBI1 [Gekko japonicus]